MNDTRIVLINTSHPGNIGATARAMKTMGLTQLYLVAPLAFPDRRADEMASGAGDILSHAVIVDTLDEAIADCTLIAGTSARTRTIPWPLCSPSTFAKKITQPDAAAHKTAILFGREQSGLSNDELQRCHYHIHIPSHPDYSSLNLAAAVQIITYELRTAALAQSDLSESAWDYPPATAEAMEHFYAHLESVMIQTGFLNPKVPRQLMARLRRLFNRIQPDVMEINILRGLLSSVDTLIPK